jgi:HEPN domain-containing protein
MNRVVTEWVQKAEGDYMSALREIRARKNPNYDSACFHAQQCVEKYLKGVLQSWEVSFPKTHDLIKLLGLCLPQHPEWQLWHEDLKLLTQFAVVFRYPGESATKDEAKHSVRVAIALRDVLRPLLQRRGAAS